MVTRERLLRFGMPAAVLGVAAATRLIALDQPGVLVFDETYYVKDAASLLELGYEGRWPDGADEAFAAGTPPAVTESAAFVAHPPLGKWVIALGMLAFGPASPYGWRFGVAVSGASSRRSTSSSSSVLGKPGITRGSLISVSGSLAT